MSRTVPIEIKPVLLTTTDGKEREFLLTAGGMNRIKKKFDVNNIKELLALEETALVPILYEALLDKNDLTEEQFNDIIPFNPEPLMRALGMLLGASFPDPPKATETTQTLTAAIQ